MEKKRYQNYCILYFQNLVYEEWTSVLQHLPIVWYGFRSKSFYKIDDGDEFDHFNNFNHQLSQIWSY